MSDLEHTAIERLKSASDMSLRLYKQPLVITYSGGKDSDVLLHLAEASGIPFEVLHSLTTAVLRRRYTMCETRFTGWKIRESNARWTSTFSRTEAGLPCGI